MSNSIRVHNTGGTVLVYDRDGRALSPGTAADVDETDPIAARHLAAGRLIRVETAEESAPEPEAEPEAPRRRKPTNRSSESGEKK